MAKLTLKSAKKAVGIGQFVEKTIKFRDVNGEDFEGEILVKVLTADEIEHITDVLKLKDDEKWTAQQYRAALLHQAVFEAEDKPFFPELADVGQVSGEMQISMYLACDEVINFTGKYWSLNKMMNSGASLSSTESAEEPLQKPSET